MLQSGAEKGETVKLLIFLVDLFIPPSSLDLQDP